MTPSALTAHGRRSVPTRHLSDYNLSGDAEYEHGSVISQLTSIYRSGPPRSIDPPSPRSPPGSIELGSTGHNTFKAQPRAYEFIKREPVSPISMESAPNTRMSNVRSSGGISTNPFDDLIDECPRSGNCGEGQAGPYSPIALSGTSRASYRWYVVARAKHFPAKGTGIHNWAIPGSCGRASRASYRR